MLMETLAARNLPGSHHGICNMQKVQGTKSIDHYLFPTSATCLAAPQAGMHAVVMNSDILNHKERAEGVNWVHPLTQGEEINQNCK